MSAYPVEYHADGRPKTVKMYADNVPQYQYHDFSADIAKHQATHKTPSSGASKSSSSKDKSISSKK
ncbi:hypothetical protein ANO14919_133720 [Xylariales sp. No.14919]|nr:hypothetical protein ANO14919_133720 [Xylariales sp. No.14919]